MMSSTPFPTFTRERLARESYESTNLQRSYVNDVFEAHERIGLGMQASWSAATNKRTLKVEGSKTVEDRCGDGGVASTPWSASPPMRGRAEATARIFASICPWKDAELVVEGESLTCPVFVTVLFLALQTFVGRLGIQSFNVGIQDIDLPRDNTIADNTSHRCEDRKEVDAGVSQRAIAVSRHGPVTARLVGRGKLSSLASDFGGYVQQSTFASCCIRVGAKHSCMLSLMSS